MLWLLRCCDELLDLKMYPSWHAHSTSNTDREKCFHDDHCICFTCVVSPRVPMKGSHVHSTLTNFCRCSCSGQCTKACGSCQAWIGLIHCVYMSGGMSFSLALIQRIPRVPSQLFPVQLGWFQMHLGMPLAFVESFGSSQARRPGRWRYGSSFGGRRSQGSL